MKIQRILAIVFGSFIFCSILLSALVVIVLFRNYAEKEFDKTANNYVISEALNLEEALLLYNYPQIIKRFNSDISIPNLEYVAVYDNMKNVIVEWRKKQIDNHHDLFVKSNYLVEHKDIYDSDNPSVMVGAIVMSFSKQNLNFLFKKSCIIIFVSAVIVAILTILLSSKITNRLINPLLCIANKMKLYDPNDNASFEFGTNSSVEEYHILNMAFQDMHKTIMKNQDMAKQNAHMAAIGQSSSHLAHDMRTPLSVLVSFVEGLENNSDKLKNAEYKNAVKNSVNKLQKMANELNDYSKANKIQRTTTELNQILKSNVLPETKFSSNHNVEIVNNIHENTNVRLDDYRIARVLTNIVNNAVQAIEHDKGAVVLESKVKVEKLILTISDNGKGMEEKHLPHIFDGFYTFGKKTGTGLGLSYCKQVVEAHGGTIEVKSEVGKGTTFTIELPDSVVASPSPVIASEQCESGNPDCFANARNDRQELAMTNKNTGSPTKPLEDDNKRIQNDNQYTHNDKRLKSLNYKDKKVIIVDDDDDILVLHNEIVKENGGLIVGEYYSGEDIMSEAGMNWSNVDMAIVDYEYKQHEKTGIDVIKFLRAKGIKEIYLCTGHYGDEEIHSKAIDAGAIAVLKKG